MESLTYERLDASRTEIRLLNVHVDDHACVRCELTTHSLTPDLEFYALSYAWGDPTVTKDIIVNGKTFAATTNLVNAFENISAAGLKSSDFLWVDAICINQDDIEERNAQIRLMTRIYSGCSAVIAWLGPEADHSTEVIEFLKHLAKEIGSAQDADIEILLRPAPPQLLERLDAQTSGDSLLSLALLLKGRFYTLLRTQPFWKRAWIFQEQVLAKRIIFLCGRTTFEDIDLRNVSTWYSSHRSLPALANLPPNDFLSCISFKNMVMPAVQDAARVRLFNKEFLFSAKPYHAAWILLVSTLALQASDPRDKVYSLLGLIDIGVNADYSKSPEDVYHEMAVNLLAHIDLDDYLNLGRLWSSTRRLSLPSWTVDWDGVSGEVFFPSSLVPHLYNADLALVEQSGLLNVMAISERILTTGGVVCDEIESLSPFSDDPLSNMKDSLAFDFNPGLPSRNISDTNILHTYAPLGIPRGQASLRLCLGDKDPSNNNRSSLDSSFLGHARCFSLLVKNMIPEAYSTAFQAIVYTDMLDLGEDRPHDYTLTTLTSSECMNLIHTIGSHFISARHFYTKKGHLGYGPKWIQESDLVCVLPGCRVPVLLRKVNDYYHFVSTCFVLGLMDGEAAQMLERGEVFMQQFDIH